MSELNKKQAEDLTSLVLQGINKEYPNYISHYMLSDADVRPPRELHPIFYGCLDWHSAVHGYWLLQKLRTIFPAISTAKAIDDLFKRSLNEENIAKELSYFEKSPSYERPYGWSWFLALTTELKKNSSYSALMDPLAKHIRNAFINFLPKQHYPVRIGMHSNTAFALYLALEYAQYVKDDELIIIIVKRSIDYYYNDTNYPIQYEPSGSDFLSAGLMEALLMVKVLAKHDGLKWLDNFLPNAVARQIYFTPATVTDREDGQLVHLDGLNFSRAWCLRAIARNLPVGDERATYFRGIAKKHVDYSLPHIASGHWMGEHWLGTFALLAALEE